MTTFGVNGLARSATYLAIIVVVGGAGGIGRALAEASAARVRSDTVSSGRSRVPSRSLATSLIPPMHSR